MNTVCKRGSILLSIVISPIVYGKRSLIRQVHSFIISECMLFTLRSAIFSKYRKQFQTFTKYAGGYGRRRPIIVR